MAPSSKAPEGPLSESARIFEERRQAGLAQAKAQRAASAGLFGDLSVAFLPPDPAKEEPPPDERLSEEEQAITRAYQDASSPATLADVEALEAMAGLDEGPSTAEELEAAHEALEDARAAQTGREAFVEHVLEPIADALARDLEEMSGSGDGEVTSTAAMPTERSPEQASASGGFSLFGHNLFGDEVKVKSSGPLAERFKWPPFSVLDARQGVWQDRKRAWLALGIQSEVGRGENLLNMSDTVLEPDPIKRAEMIKRRDAKTFNSGGPGSLSKQFKEQSTTAVSRRLAPGTGGGGCWLGGPKTSSAEKYGKGDQDDVVLDENGQPLASKTGTSIFDPVLTELIYSWFVPPDGCILDPFAGGSVRGIVAAKLKRMYVGIELRPEQILANQVQAEKICTAEDVTPVWIEGDSANAKELTEGTAFDFLMACPPYGDLEQYSEDPRDLSNMTFEAFAAAYEAIIAAGLELLKPDRFACFVVGDYRDEDGFYRGLPELTVRCFEQHGAKKYNEGVLVTSVGSLPIRINKQFGKGRKLGKSHQNVLIFVKGDPRRAAEACGGQQEFSL